MRCKKFSPSTFFQSANITTKHCKYSRIGNISRIPLLNFTSTFYRYKSISTNSFFFNSQQFSLIYFIFFDLVNFFEIFRIWERARFSIYTTSRMRPNTQLKWLIRFVLEQADLHKRLRLHGNSSPWNGELVFGPFLTFISSDSASVLHLTNCVSLRTLRTHITTGV